LSGTSCLPLPDNIFLWKQDSIIRNCFPTCTKCESSEISQCTACYPSFVKVFTADAVKKNLKTHSCDSKCPDTHYMTTEYMAVVGVYCLPCETLVTNCMKCYQRIPTEKAICQKCKTGFFVSVDLNTLFTNTCAKCDDSCAECAGSATNCVSCAAGKVLSYDATKDAYECIVDPKTLPVTNRVCPYNKFLYQGQCHAACPTGTYRRKRYTDDCTACQDSTDGCFSCETETATCTVCQPSFKKNPSNACFLCHQNSVQCCDVGKGTNLGLCTVCSGSNVADCFTPEYATSCAAGFVKNANGVCVAQISMCFAYSYTGASCLMCQDSNLVEGSNCVAACSAGLFKYVQSSKLKCEGCDARCATCSMPATNNRCPTCKAQNTGVKKVGSGCLDCPNKVDCSHAVAVFCVERWSRLHLHQLLIRALLLDKQHLLQQLS